MCHTWRSASYIVQGHFKLNLPGGPKKIKLNFQLQFWSFGSYHFLAHPMLCDCDIKEKSLLLVGISNNNNNDLWSDDYTTCTNCCPYLHFRSISYQLFHYSISLVSSTHTPYLHVNNTLPVPNLKTALTLLCCNEGTVFLETLLQ